MDIKSRLDEVLDEASAHPVARDTLGFIREIASWLLVAPPAYGAVLGGMFIFAVGLVIPLLFNIYGEAFGLFGHAFFRVIGCFIQICGTVSGMYCWGAAAYSFFRRQREQESDANPPSEPAD